MRKIKERFEQSRDDHRQYYEGYDPETRHVCFSRVYLENDEHDEENAIIIEINGLEYRFYLAGIDRDAFSTRFNYVQESS